MKEKLMSLIKNSSLLKDSQKQMYLSMIDNLSEDRMIQLIAFLEKESSAQKKVKEEADIKKSQANKEYIQEAKMVYEEEKGEVMHLLEVEDCKKADELISNL